MDRLSKISRLKSLKKLIDKQELILKAAQEDLKGLEEEYKRESISELPILLFQVDETLPMPDDGDFEYECIYYCPDLDDITYRITRSRKELLPNTLDLRSMFVNFGMPEHVWPGRPDYNIVYEAVAVLKERIEEIFKNNEINSWNDLRDHLKNLKEAKKVLK